MKKKWIVCLMLFFVAYSAFGQKKVDKNAHLDKKKINILNDGPYIFIKNDRLVEKKIENGKILSKDLPINKYKTVFKPERSNYIKAKNLAVLSDVHGQYDIAVELLKKNKVIDDELNWNYGKGHLVIVGDVFDRGPKVNEMLWLVYKLEKQAEKENGKVHLLLGNHEYMVLHQDLRYLNEKYPEVSKMLNKSYTELYGPNTIIGRWLRSKPTILKIGKLTFVHGGISKEFLLAGYNRNKTNKLMREAIDREKKEMKTTGFYGKYFGKYGPVWYRGYFRDSLPENEINDILKKIKSEHIIVGHCSHKKIIQVYNKKIFGVDASMKNGEYGELLFIENGSKFYRGTLNGKKIEIDDKIKNDEG